MHPLNQLIKPFGIRLSRPDGKIRLERIYPIALDYKIQLKVRWTAQKPNLALLSILKNQTLVFQRNLAMIEKFPLIKNVCEYESEESLKPRWHNSFISPLDGMSIYWAIASRRPKTYLEIGSGNSTRFARQAIQDLQLETRVISIDPYPRAEIDRICDEVIRKPFEEADLGGVISRLTERDVIFLDGSHRCLQNSDATVFFNEFMWNLPDRVLIGVHDIYLPFDYPEAWLERYYSEQYLLAAAILADRQRSISIQLPCYFSHSIGLVDEVLKDTWTKLPVDLDRTGGAFWFECNH